jgi:hypothetical protein
MPANFIFSAASRSAFFLLIRSLTFSAFLTALKGAPKGPKAVSVTSRGSVGSKIKSVKSLIFSSSSELFF